MGEGLVFGGVVGPVEGDLGGVVLGGLVGEVGFGAEVVSFAVVMEADLDVGGVFVG